MTDLPIDTAPSDQPAPTGPFFRVLAQFVRDLSFENPRAPESLRIEAKPGIDMGVEMNAKGRADGLFEVDLKLSVKASTPETALFHVELVYGGLFQIGNVPEADVEKMLLIECPRFLFPFARQIIADATLQGGFYPPFMVDPLDFAAIYNARKEQMQAQGQPPAQA